MECRKRQERTELDYMEKQLQNQTFLFLDSTLFGLTLGALDINTVVPTLIAPLTTSPGLVVGVAVLVKQTLFLLPQVLVVLLHRRLTNLPHFIWSIYTTDRLLIVVVLVAILAGASAASGMILFITWFAVFNMAEGLVQVPWMNLYATAVPRKSRGPLFGASILTVSIGSVLLAPVISTSASSPYPFGMVRLLGLTALMLLPSLLFFRRIEVRPRILDPVTQRPIIRQWKELLKNADVVRVTAVQGCLTLGSMFFPFLFLLAQNDAELSSSTLIIASIVGSAAGGVTYGAVSRYVGNKAVLQIVGVTGLIGGALCSAGIFVESLDRLALVGGFALAGSCVSGWLGYYNYLFELTSEDRHILLLSLINALLLPITLAAPYLGEAITSHPSAWWAIVQAGLFASAVLFACTLRSPVSLGKECPAP